MANSVAIFIPTYRRAHKILRAFKNARDSSPLITNIYFIVEKDDQESIDVLESQRFLYFFNERTRGSSGALNTAYLKTNEKYFFNAADDLDFKPGWLEKCLEKMTGPIKVVGTNDLHNPGVLQQRYAIHCLMDRDYIREYSGTFDEDNVIISESYKHNWADREFCEIAKLRGVFATCLEAVVEHLHWQWGLSSKDETYAKQDGTKGYDSRLFRQRRPLYIEKIKNEQKSKITELCRLAYKYGTDKCPQIKHSYTPFYYKLFNEKRLSIRKVLEFGIGAERGNKNQPIVGGETGIRRYLSRGASLYMWRDFFPNAEIFGADINPDTMFKDERIQTYLCNEKNKGDIANLIDTIGFDMDIVIDDASHHVDDQVFLAAAVLPLLKEGATYVIEDTHHTRYLRSKLRGLGSYEYDVPDIPRKRKGETLLVIKK